MAYILGELNCNGAIDGKKALLLCILQILSDYSDSDNLLTNGEIISKLQSEYGISANRNTVTRNLQMLRDIGFEINRLEGKFNGTYLGERVFDDLEIRWLIDGVLNSKYMPEKYARDLIEKLKKLSNKRFYSGLGHVSALRELPHQNNREISHNIQVLDEAIESRRRVSFIYNQMNCERKLVPINNIPREVLPVNMFCTNSQYYLVANEFSCYGLTHFRLDRITDIALCQQLSKDDIKLWQKLNISAAAYAAEHPYMYGGKPLNITLKMPCSLAGAVCDTFGSAADMTPICDEYMLVRLKAAAEGMRFFALQYGPNCEVLEPKELREQLISDIKDMAAKYCVKGA